MVQNDGAANLLNLIYSNHSWKLQLQTSFFFWLWVTNWEVLEKFEIVTKSKGKLTVTLRRSSIVFLVYNNLENYHSCSKLKMKKHDVKSKNNSLFGLGCVMDLIVLISFIFLFLTKKCSCSIQNSFNATR